MPKVIHRLSEVAEEIWQRLGKRISLATPLGVGKPNPLLNLLYLQALQHPDRELEIHTALSLNPPRPSGELARRFFDPFAKRQWGSGFPELAYARDAELNRLPSNVRVHEFYFRAGSALHSSQLQRAYQSINYTHVAEAVAGQKINLIVQIIAKDSTTNSPRYSLGCNPDVTLDLVDLCQERGNRPLIVGVLHPELPFLEGDAEVTEGFFDFIVDDSTTSHSLFALPRMPVDDVDHAIGFFASQLVLDRGTLQVGIGSLSDAVVTAMLLRHQKPELYIRVSRALWKGRPRPPELTFEESPFIEGIYGLSEMVTDGYMHLRRAGILKRTVADKKTGLQTFLHGAFCLGSKEFYEWLRTLGPAERKGLRMSRVSKVNDLYDPDEITLRLQRQNARFLNTCMQVSLLGGASSETLPDGRVISGVGGQYNFVAMAQELKGARSILMLRSTREEKGRRSSNITWSSANLTIPRHLRDIVITEYGVADLRYRTDEHCIRSLIEIADSEFQPELVRQAQKSGKLSSSYRVPDWARQNVRPHLGQTLGILRKEGAFPAFPLGSDFEANEERLAVALPELQALSSHWRGRLKLLHWMLQKNDAADQFHDELQRMGLDSPQGLKEKIWRRLLAQALNKTQDRF